MELEEANKRSRGRGRRSEAMGRTDQSNLEARVRMSKLIETG
jgi:hypothetical protein